MKTLLVVLSIVLTLFAGVIRAHAQGTTAFTYQGQLRDGGTNANGTYTMTFKLYDAVSGGNQIGSTVTNSPTLANGLFTVNLDFGAGAFDGNARWLEINVDDDTLTPRVQVLPVPYAQFASVAATVTNGAIMNAQLAGNAVSSTNIQNGAVTTAQIAAGAVTNANLTANAVNATNIASGQVVKRLNGLTDSVTLSAGANVALFTNGNALQISAGVPNFQVFLNSGTFVVPTNVNRIMVELWGGGGGGGSGLSDQTNYWNTGGGGGGGGYGWNVFNVTPGYSYTVTIPTDSNAGQPGGTTSFGSLLSATGGSPGGNATTKQGGMGGAGGSSTGGFYNCQGGQGFEGIGETKPGSYNGGKGGGVWRGGSGGSSGPGEGGDGGGPGTWGYQQPGNGGGSGIVIVYY